MPRLRTHESNILPKFGRDMINENGPNDSETIMNEWVMLKLNIAVRYSVENYAAVAVGAAVKATNSQSQIRQSSKNNNHSHYIHM